MMTTNHLISGDPLSPASTDLIAQTANLPVGEPVPEGWRVLTGNERTSLIGRLAYRRDTLARLMFLKDLDGFFEATGAELKRDLS
jgi:hypothetical protein